jgi:hypothetical protein
MTDLTSAAEQTLGRFSLGITCQRRPNETGRTAKKEHDLREGKSSCPK